jgi:hypothetical protein
MTPYSGFERRSSQDRRQRTLTLWQWLHYKGKRETGRRSADRKRIVAFDRYRPSLMVAAMVVLGLSLLDALFTLVLLSQGAREINPVMRYFIDHHGPRVFIIVKYGLTALSVLIVILCNEAIAERYRRLTGLLPIFAAVFGGVVIWQLFLLSLR